MTDQQPEALRLAEMLLSGVAMIPEIDLPEAAAELRRLHAENEALIKKLSPITSLSNEGENMPFDHPDFDGVKEAVRRENVTSERPANKHPDDAAVDALAALMKAKLAEKRANGYGGWNDKTQCSQQRLSDMLRAHVDKGDPVDVANFCAMLSARGEGIAAAPQAVQGIDGKHVEAVMLEHSGCGSNTQVNQLTVRLNPGDKIVMRKGEMTQAFDRANATAAQAKQEEK